MKLFDVNILIYSHRSDQAHHDFFRSRLNAALRGTEPCGLSTAVATGFLRIVTQPNFPNGPTPLPQALAVIETLTGPDGCQWLHPGSRHWQLTAELCRATQSTGKVVSDASHAALAIEHGCTWVSRDADFERFTRCRLRWEPWVP